ncbi:MAG: APC family permease [Armatimonadetes bacterium]|nr:APC family permease [Armatimonadota bacterium]
MATRTKFKHILFGAPIATKKAHHEKLIIPFGLAVFASDALSSVAYASEEILKVLVLAGAMAMPLLTPISLALCVLMLVVGFSYYQTIQAYPNGGGTYIVTTENLGSVPGRIAAGALLTDYVLTVAVSISSGVAAVISMVPAVQPHAVELGLGVIAILCLLNLRGAKESGALFSFFVYSFVAMILALVATCIFKGAGQAPVPYGHIEKPSEGWHAFGAFLILRGFAASCTALTGTEAIADGVQAFKEPAAKNAGRTLGLMIALLLVMFIGLGWSAQHFGIVPMHETEKGYKTVIALLAQQVWGQGPLFTGILVTTAFILFLAANTAFADFPRLCSFVARDGFMPRQLMSVGDRLVFQNGIIVLGLFAGLLVVVFRADTHALIPLYALGVFISFTLSQTGMAVKFKRMRALAKKGLDEHGEPLASGEVPSRTGRRLTTKMGINAFGALVTFVVAIILLWTKFQEGAYIIVIALAVMLAVFKVIRMHYDYLAGELNVREGMSVPAYRSANLLLVPRLHRGVLKAIGYAKASATDVRGLHVTLDYTSAAKIKDDWARFGVDMPLVILDSPYRSLIEPVLDYIDQMIAEDPDLIVTVIVPQAVPKYFFQSLLHNNAAVGLKLALGTRRNVVITNIRYFLT